MTKIAPVNCTHNTQVALQNVKLTKSIPIEVIPDDLMKCIFSFVGSRHCAMLPLVCKRWKLLLDQESTWSILLSPSMIELKSLELIILRNKQVAKLLRSLREKLTYPSLELREMEMPIEVPPVKKGKNFVVGDKLVFRDEFNDSELKIYDYTHREVMDSSQCQLGRLVVSRGIIYYIDSKSCKLFAYQSRSGKQIWDAIQLSSTPQSIYINEIRNCLCVLGTSFHKQSIHEVTQNFYIFDLYCGTCLSETSMRRKGWKFWSICGDYAYYIEDKIVSDFRNIIVQNIYIPNAKAFSPFRIIFKEDMFRIIGAVQNDIHVFCTKYSLLVYKISPTKSENLLSHTLQKHMMYVYCTHDAPVSALFEDLLCIHVYDSLKYEYFLHFWDMSTQKIIKEYKVPFELQDIYFSGTKLIALSSDHKMVSVEFTTTVVDTISEKLQSCSIM